MRESKIESLSLLNDLSLIVRSENQPISESCLLEWFQFLGGKPAEVVLVDYGSSLEVQQGYWKLFLNKQVDKLQLSQLPVPGASSTPQHIQLYNAGAVACKSYLLWVNVCDPLPEGCDENWLEEAIGYLNQNKAIAITTGTRKSLECAEPSQGWYCSDQCNLNFALMKRSVFIAATDEYAGDYITAGFTGQNPATAENREEEMLQVALEKYGQRHNLHSFCKLGSANWKAQPSVAGSTDVASSPTMLPVLP